MHVRRHSFLSALLLAALSVTVVAQREKPKETKVLGHTMYTLLKPGEIPAILDPEFVSVDEARKVYYDDEPLMVVRNGEEVKGYSTWHLDHHEIVNDYINGEAITVTW